MFKQQSTPWYGSKTLCLLHQLKNNDQNKKNKEKTKTHANNSKVDLHMTVPNPLFSAPSNANGRTSHEHPTQRVAGDRDEAWTRETPSPTPSRNEWILIANLSICWFQNCGQRPLKQWPCPGKLPLGAAFKLATRWVSFAFLFFSRIDPHNCGLSLSLGFKPLKQWGQPIITTI